MHTATQGNNYATVGYMNIHKNIFVILCGSKDILLYERLHTRAYTLNTLYQVTTGYTADYKL